MLVTFITIIHVSVCIFLILVILLQAGKDAGMSAAFGGGGSGSVFGGRGAGSFLGRVTAVCASIFFLTSLTLSFAASYRPSVTNLIDAPPVADAGAAAPAEPGAATPTPAEPAEKAAPAPQAPAPVEKAAPAPGQPSAPPPANK